ncbi:hypothetical protein BGZ94_001998, partial [Podila epigama]
KINIIRAPQPPSQVIAPLPVHSRHTDEAKAAQDAIRVAQATQLSIEAKKRKAETRLARERALLAAKEDREGLRLKNGSVLRRILPATSSLKDLFDIVREQDHNIGNADISLIQTPIPAPQPITPSTSTPGGWLSPGDIPGATDIVDASEEDDNMDMDLDVNSGGEEHEDDEIEHEVDYGDHDDEEDNNSEENDDSENDEDDEDEMMHALPIHINPGHAGRGRGRGRGRGMRGMPFSGAGHSLSGGGGRSSVSAESESTSEQVQETSVESDALRRQRILEAMENRVKNQEQQASSTAVVSKRVKPKEILSLKARCAHEVAVMLTRSDTAASRNLKGLNKSVGSQITEAIVQELIKLKKLDQLSFKRLHRCPVVNMILDGYSRTTDSLLDSIGRSQAHSLTYFSLREATFLTDKGFLNLSHFEELEYLDLSHCRVTDKTLEFIQNLPYLSSLHLSSTKVTSSGLARVINKSAWKAGLHTLDLSYCQGVAGRSVLVNLQELENLRTLKLNNTRSFDQSPVQVPITGAFQRLLHVDLARTPINGADLVALSTTFQSLESLNLTECVNVSTEALEHCAKHMSSLQQLVFPNRENDLLTVLPLVARLPLTHLDLTGFLFVGDDAILNLASATSLQMLSLSGSKLTDVGAAVFLHMSSLRELSLDRTDIGDKAMEYLRDLGRVEVLSLKQCRRLTTAGVLTLGRSAFFGLKLKRLNLGYNPYIHDEALAAFAHCHGLNTLNLEHTDVSEHRVLLLQNSLPNLTQLRIQGITSGAVYEENPRPTFDEQA